MDRSSCVFYIKAMLSDISRYKISKMSKETIALISDLFMRQESFKMFLTMGGEYCVVNPHFNDAHDYIDYQIHRYCKKQDVEFTPRLVKLLTPVVINHKVHGQVLRNI